MMSAPRNTISFHVHNRQLEDAHVNGNAQPWRFLPGFLTVEEVMAASPSSLPLNDIQQAYLSKEDYLGILYALTRFEASEPLRHVIQAYKAAGCPTDEFFIYSKVFIKGYTLRPSGALARLSFSTEQLPEGLDWQQCKLLKHGTLVALAPAKDRFQEHCILAIIDDNRWDDNMRNDEDAVRPTVIDVMWTDPGTAIVDSQEYVMIEAKNGYFESKLHTLIGLQHAALEMSRFDKYLVEADEVIREQPCPLNMALPASSSTFDESQREAFDVMTSRELALIQGPPGTGKTYTTVVGLEHLVKSRNVSQTNAAPIIVASQTNHAADQLLRLCLDREIGMIVRLGGQSKSEIIKEHSMFNLRSYSKFKSRNRAARHAQEDIAVSLKSCLDDISYAGVLPARSLLDEGLITLKQFESLDEGDGDWSDGSNSDDDKLSKWLGKDRDKLMAHLGQRQNDLEYDECPGFTQEDDIGDGPGEYVFMKHSLAGYPLDSTVDAAKRELKRNSDLWSIKPRRRAMVYEYLHLMMRMRAAARFRVLLEKYDTASKDVKIGRWDSDCRIIQKEGIDIIGCTTTGLSKYRGLLAALQPKILVVEEAAETQEAYISAAMFPSLERVVLVGDHQQLAPHVDVRMLGEDPYHLNVSLFERLVSKVGLPYAMLKVQRRMAPDIREIVQTFYPLLRDHESVAEREPIPGMGDVRLWWFQHAWPESRNKDMSYLNPDEASMILHFIKHLLRNGLEPDQVTVLSYYNGQVDLVKARLQQDDELSVAYPSQEWSVRTVDGFQGEENEVVILSIVRGSAIRYNAGFVSDENRAVVAVSRARRGCFIFGNSQNLLQANEDSRKTWQKVIDVLSIQRRIEQWLPIQCTQHKNDVEIKDVEEWFELQGGCRLDCGGRCSKGHSCRLKCHPISSTRCTCSEKTCPCSKIQTICRQEQNPIQEEKPKSGPKRDHNRVRSERRQERFPQRPVTRGRAAITMSSSSHSSTARGRGQRSLKQQSLSQTEPPATTGTLAEQGRYGLVSGDMIREMGYEQYEQALELRARQTELASTAGPAAASKDDGTGVLIDFSDTLGEEGNRIEHAPRREEDLISFED